MDALRNVFRTITLRRGSATRTSSLLLAMLSVLAIFALLSACEQPSATTGSAPTAAAHVVSTPTTIPETPTTIPVTPTTAPATPTPTTAPPTPTHRPATPTPKPTARATTPPSTGVNENPWGYDFNKGTLIYDPPTGFCSYFACISSFSDGKGYVVQCNNGQYSKSGGRKGVCSKQGGFKRILYAH